MFVSKSKSMHAPQKSNTTIILNVTHDSQSKGKKIEICVQLKMKTFELPSCHQTQTTKKKTQKLKAFQNLECKKKTLKS
jgi:hypothetical protein